MILGIESSCDESALALFSPDQGIVGEWVNSQIAKHVELKLPKLKKAENTSFQLPKLKLPKLKKVNNG